MSTPNTGREQTNAGVVANRCFGCLAVISTILQPIFFVADLPSRIRRALRKRAFGTGHKIEQPPFPPLVWDEFDRWEGEVELAGWSDFRVPGDAPTVSDRVYPLTVVPADQTKEAAMPSPAQAAAINHLMAESRNVANAVCEAAAPYYNAAFAAEEGFFEDLHPISSPIEVRGLLSLSFVHIHHHRREGCALIGLGFRCAWDVEHGFGVLLHRSTVVALGQSDVSFTEPCDEQRSPQ